MNWAPVIISAKTACLSILVTFFIGILLAHWVVRMRSEKARMLIDGILTLPMVLPPTVMGFFLLFIFGVKRPVGKFILEFFGWKIVFTWWATVIAAVVISLPHRSNNIFILFLCKRERFLICHFCVLLIFLTGIPAFYVMYLFRTYFRLCFIFAYVLYTFCFVQLF